MTFDCVTFIIAEIRDFIIVITSYSIHYTKLYEKNDKNANVKHDPQGKDRELL